MPQKRDDNDERDLSNEIDNMYHSEGRGIDRKKLIELWSTVQVAEIMIKHASEMLRKAHDDLEFYKIVSGETEK